MFPHRLSWLLIHKNEAKRQLLAEQLLRLEGICFFQVSLVAKVGITSESVFQRGYACL